MRTPSHQGYSAAVRIALLSPYSWTYPGGVTRHIEALAGELSASGHEPRILAPFDPDDALSARMHRGARPQQRSVPEGFVSLGRTVGMPANGAVSNMALTPHAVFTLRRELRERRLRRRAHPRAGRAASSAGTRSARPDDLPLVGTFHTYSENAPHERHRGRPARRAAAHEPPARPHRGLRGRRLDGAALLRRALPHHPQRRPPRRLDADARPRPSCCARGLRREPPRSGSCGSCSSARPSNARACRSCCAPSKRCATTCRRRSRSSAPAPEEVAHMMLDDRGVHALGKVSERAQARRARARRGAVRALAGTARASA